MASELAIEIATLRGWTRIVPSHILSWAHRGYPSLNTDSAFVPEPDKNSGDCMELMRFVISHEAIISISQYHQKCGKFGCEIIIDPGLRTSLYAQAETLEQAIALACRDALKALKEG